MRSESKEYRHQKGSCGLSPLISPSCKVLILGSYPSLLSLQAGEYYANPQNAFWKVMSGAFGFTPDLSYQQRVSLLKEHGIGLWDVFASCERRKSADASITSEIPNNIPRLLNDFPEILAIGLNGRAAERGYKQNFSSISIPAFYLPSSSPAHTMPLTDKSAVWIEKILLFL